MCGEQAGPPQGLAAWLAEQRQVTGWWRPHRGTGAWPGLPAGTVAVPCVPESRPEWTLSEDTDTRGARVPEDAPSVCFA